MTHISHNYYMTEKRQLQAVLLLKTNHHEEEAITSLDSTFESLGNLGEDEEPHDYDDIHLPSTTPGRLPHHHQLPPMSVDTSKLMKDIATPKTDATATMGDSFFMDDMSPVPLHLTPAPTMHSVKRKAGAPSSSSASAKRSKEQ